jgi:RNA polymerase sigma-70 factor (ECF subfamily)
MRPVTPHSIPEFADWYREEFGFVVNLLRRFGVSQADLEDLTHDVFLTAYRTQTQFDSSRALRPWLMGIAFRVVSDFQRKARHHFEKPELDTLSHLTPDLKPSPLESAEAAQGRQWVQQSLLKLEFDRRAVFVFHELEGLPVSQVAHMLNIPEGTAWSRLRQARIEFTQAIRKLAAGGSP